MQKKRWFHITVPILLIVMWFGAGGLGGPTFGKISDVSTNNQASFLPSSAESTQVQKLQSKYQEGQAIPAIVVIESDRKLTGKDMVSYADRNAKLADVNGVQAPVVGPIPSKDAKALEFIVPIANDAKLKTVAADLREAASDKLPGDSRAFVTGPAGLSADLITAFGGIDGILLIVALVAVFAILLAVYRSLLLPVLVLVNAMFALCAAIFVVYMLAKNGVIELNGQSQGILSILVIGAATDYSLLLVSRYREALGVSTSKWDAVLASVKRSAEPIIASSFTVILALLCLLFSDLNSNRSLGPIAATGIAFSLLATLTFLPALLAVFGRAAFWPSKIAASVHRKSVTVISGQEELAGLWKRVGRLLVARTRTTWVIIVVVLAVGSLGLLQLKASGVPQTDLVLSRSNAADGQRAIARHFSAGSGAPVLVAIPQESLAKTQAVLREDKNLTDVTAYSGQGPTSDVTKAKIVDGKALLSATLTVDPYSSQAEAAIKSLRTTLANHVEGALVGGTTALSVDTNVTAVSDLKKIIPLVLLMIVIVLAILLRSIIAPLVLIATVVLSFAATMGISALVFNHIFHFPGADASVPLFGFVFLVALGVDYNIFLVSRTREEALKYGTRAAVLHSLGKTGGVITSAGVVLAATFAALGIIPILFLAQLAFIVAFGVLLDTVVIRSLLVPALFYDIGARVWWPSRKIKR